MTLQEKYNQYTEIFNKHFIYKDDHTKPGANIPLVRVNFDYQRGEVDDGTINMAHYLTYLHLTGDQESIRQTCLSISRLSVAAFFAFHDKFPKENVPFHIERGFFMRDDISNSMASKFSLQQIRSGYADTFEVPQNEDPCYSLYTSQDQIWNLAPILSKVEPRLLGLMLQYVVNNKHVIYNPYASAALHYWTYLPSFNESKVKPWDRIEDRKKNLKYKVKVKRGANNWYFAYGFRKTLNKINNQFQLGFNKCSTFLSALWYKPFIFLADRVYHHYICKWLGLKVKNNSYYCMGLAGDAWYGGDVHKRIVQKFNKSLDTDELFLPNIVVLSDKADEINVSKLGEWLESYPEPCLEGTMQSPITFMILCAFYFKQINNQ